MSRCALLVVCVLASCSKSAGNQDKVAAPPAPTGASDAVAMPRAGAGPSMGAQAAPAAPAAQGASDPLRLKPEEGTLAIQAPADAKAGAQAVAKIVVTPGKGFHVNTEYPTKLTLETPSGVSLAKTEFKAGGHDKGKGDAEAFDEQQLAFQIAVTPSASGSYTVNGQFKFAVCDANQCLPKKETIAIQVAAK
jgi:hypothetical protein